MLKKILFGMLLAAAALIFSACPGTGGGGEETGELFVYDSTNKVITGLTAAGRKAATLTIPEGVTTVNALALQGSQLSDELRLLIEGRDNVESGDYSSLNGGAESTSGSLKYQAAVFAGDPMAIVTGPSGSLTSLVIPDKLGSYTPWIISKTAFQNAGLTSADLGPVRYVGEQAFDANTGLTDITFSTAANDNRGVIIAERAFARTPYEVDLAGGTGVYASGTYGISSSDDGTFTYNKVSKGSSAEITITGLTAGASISANTLAIPSTIDGAPVLSIADYAFIYDAENSWDGNRARNFIKHGKTGGTPVGTTDRLGEIETLTIASSVTSIGDNAFGSCDNLTSVTFDAGSGSITLGSFDADGSAKGDTYEYHDPFGMTPVSLGVPEWWGINGENQQAPAASGGDSVSVKPHDDGSLFKYMLFDVKLNGTTEKRAVLTGKSASFSAWSATEASPDTVPGKVNDGAADYIVTGIGGGALAHQSDLKYLTLPDSLDFIGDRAFLQSGVISLEFPNGAELFQGAFKGSDLSRISIRNSGSFYLRDAQVFMGAPVEIDDENGDLDFTLTAAVRRKEVSQGMGSLPTDGTGADAGLNYLKLGSEVTLLKVSDGYNGTGWDAANSVYTLPHTIDGANVVALGNRIFGANSAKGSIETVKVGAYVKDIPESSLREIGLQTVEFLQDGANGPSLETVGAWSFMQNPLTSITFPATLETMDNGPFIVTGLKTLTLGSDVSVVETVFDSLDNGVPPGTIFYGAHRSDIYNAADGLIYAKATDMNAFYKVVNVETLPQGTYNTVETVTYTNTAYDSSGKYDSGTGKYASGGVDKNGHKFNLYTFTDADGDVEYSATLMKGANAAIPSSVESGGNTYSVDAIFYGAFDGMNLGNVTIPASVKKIFSQAFVRVTFSSLTFDGETMVFEGSFAENIGLSNYSDVTQIIAAGSDF